MSCLEKLTAWPELDEQLFPVRTSDGLTVRVVGVGATGSITARYVAVFLAALRCETRLFLVDGDDFKPKNASNMLFSWFGNKAEVVRAELLEYVEDSRLSLVAIDQRVTLENVAELLPGGVDEVVLLCVDNHEATKLISDYCEGREGFPGVSDICLISVGDDAVGIDSSGRVRRGGYGNVQVYIRRGGTDVSPSLTSYHPEMDQPAEPVSSDADEPQYLFTNLMAAAAICNTFWLYLCDALHYSELAFDIVDGRMRPLGIPAPSWAEADRVAERSEGIEA